MRIGKISYVLLVAALISGCGRQDDANHKGLIYCSEGSPATFNPQLITSGTTVDATSFQLYDRLLEVDPKSKQIEASLAKSWTVSNDGLIYRFYLRPDVSFHQTPYFTPTRTLNADDVVFSFNRWLDPNSEYHNISGGSYPFFFGVGLHKLIRSVVAVDGLTVEFTLNEPNSAFLSNLATDFAIILSKEYGDQLLKSGDQENLDKRPIGSGPFVFNRYKQGSHIRYSKHKNYWGESGNVETLVFDITPSSPIRFAKLMTGECDHIAYPLNSELTALKSKPNLSLIEETGLNVGFWAFNTSKPPFDNANIRKALSLAVNLDGILDAVYYNQAIEAKNLIPQTSWAFNSEQSAHRYDPGEAQRLLEQEGYLSGFNLDIWAMPVQRQYNPNARKTAQLIQADLAKIGIKARIVSYEWRTFLKRLSNAEHDTVLIGWNADNADPDNFFSPLLSCDAVATGNNRSFWCNESFDGLLKQALSTESVSERKAFYDKAQAMIKDQMPLLPIAHASKFEVMNKRVKNYAINPYGGLNFSKVELGSDSGVEQR